MGFESPTSWTLYPERLIPFTIWSLAVRKDRTPVKFYVKTSERSTESTMKQVG